MKKIFFILPILFLGLLVSSCKDDDKPVSLKEVQLNVTIEKPIDFPEAVLSEPKAVLTETNTGNVYAVKPEQFTDNTFSIKVKEGNYTLQATAKMSYKTAQGILSETLLELATDMPVAGDKDTEQKNVAFIYKGSASNFVIEEIFFTGTQTPEGKQYDNDKYIRITNNSSATLYADGLALLVSEFGSDEKIEAKPDIMNTAMAVSILYVIPGKGDEHPVKPGKSIILCQSAINHKNDNPNSFSLEKADFEWLDDHSFALSENPNNPNVPNMINYFDKENGVWAMYNNGYKTYALAKMQVSNDEFFEKYKYDYSYDFILGDIVVPYPNSCMKVPNAWILDAVNLSNKADFQWIPVAAALDAGWTFAGDFVNDNSRYGKSVRRKVEKEIDGRRILKDTNNSTDDFEPKAKPSLMN